MQVNVFISAVQHNSAAPTFLLLPLRPQANIPKHLQGVEWRYLTTTEADDSIIGMAPADVEAAVVRDGYLVASTSGSVDGADYT